ncbi:MAG: sulfur carrier protein ThiS adenylyltransferase ThiF [Desulfovibrio sp.]|nr:sulfur carrier protein ThiS adenylyltransferase ThiF [Desulfovibrio sp.]
MSVAPSFPTGLGAYLTDGQRAVVGKCSVGLAGLGGIGSNVAMLLARSGIRTFVLLDMDRVEASNLNRQAYFPKDVGAFKADALSSHLHALDSDITCKCVYERLTRDNVGAVLDLCDLWIEGLDGADDKAMFVEAALMKGIRVFSASGIAGYGGPPLRKRTVGNLSVFGDFERDVAVAPPLAPRVMWAAAMMSDAVLNFLLQREKSTVFNM